MTIFLQIWLIIGTAMFALYTCTASFKRVFLASYEDYQHKGPIFIGVSFTIAAIVCIAVLPIGMAYVVYVAIKDCIRGGHQMNAPQLPSDDIHRDILIRVWWWLIWRLAVFLGLIGFLFFWAL